MIADSLHTVATIGWNGIRIEIPTIWETIVTGHRHLIFEEDFTPIFQIRWKKIGQLNPAKWREKSDQWWQQLDVASQATPLPVEFQSLDNKFSQTRYFKGKQPMESGGLCYCSHCHTLFFFQQLNAQKNMWEKTAKVLSTLTCHGESNTLWQVQDFSLSTPKQYDLSDYTFKAGLTRLSLNGDNCNIQICRLAQASQHLNSQSLEDLLFTLSGTRQIMVDSTPDQHECSGSRAPSITQQILFRIKKEKPFMLAKIRHLSEQDRVLCCVASSTRPIFADALRVCYETFKIV